MKKDISLKINPPIEEKIFLPLLFTILSQLLITRSCVETGKFLHNFDAIRIEKFKIVSIFDDSQKIGEESFTLEHEGMKMPTESSIYWDSVGSQHSISIGSSGDGCSSGSASRHYVDPWDLENYAYLRRHSVAGIAQQVPPRHHHRRSAYRLSQDARAHSEYWWANFQPLVFALQFFLRLFG